MNDTYATSDFDTVSYLRAVDIYQDKIYAKSEDRNRIMFLYNDKEATEKSVNDFKNGKAMVSPLRLMNEISNLKTLIFDWKLNNK